MLFISGRLLPNEPTLLPLFDFEVFLSFDLGCISFLGLSYGTDLNLQSSSATFNGHYNQITYNDIASVLAVGQRSSFI
jgi:hypothetical protein